MNQGNLFLTGFLIGDRVQTHPATDSWMQGDRYGEVVKIGHAYVHVKLDKSGLTKKFAPENLIRIEVEPVGHIITSG